MSMLRPWTEDQDVPPLALGSARGHRAFTYTASGHLGSIWAEMRFWPGKDLVYKAACVLSHDVPTEQCRCGFYAVYGQEADIAAHVPDHIDNVVYASVQMTGRVVFGSSGVMRGAKMRLEALLVPRRFLGFTMASRLETLYQVPVYMQNGATAFKSAYPLAQMSPGTIDLDRRREIPVRLAPKMNTHDT